MTQKELIILWEPLIFIIRLYNKKGDPRSPAIILN